MTASKVIVTTSKLDALANSIAAKSGATLPLTIDEMKTAVDSIEGGGTGGIYQDANGYIVLGSEESGGTGTSGYTIDENGYIKPDEKQLVLNWDFTQSLTDTVSGKTAILYNDAVQDENGVTISAANQYMYFTGMRRVLYRTYEFDIVSFARANGGVHHRFIMFSTDSGLIYRSNSRWSYYTSSAVGSSGWATDTSVSSQTVLNGKTLKLEIRPDGDYWYIDNEFWYKPTTQHSYYSGAGLYLGSSGNSCMNTVIAGARMYVGFDS